MATEKVMQALKKAFGRDADVVSFSGKTEVVGDMRRVYLSPDLDAFIAFPKDATHFVAPVDGTIDKVWVKKDQDLVVTLNRRRTGGLLVGTVSNASFTATVSAAGFASLYRGDTISIKVNPITSMRHTEALMRHVLGDPEPRTST